MRRASFAHVSQRRSDLQSLVPQGAKRPPGASVAVPGDPGRRALVIGCGDRTRVPGRPRDLGDLGARKLDDLGDLDARVVTTRTRYRCAQCYRNSHGN